MEAPGDREGHDGTAAAVALGFLSALFVTVFLGEPGVRGHLPGERREQPVAFNHKKHVQELGIECSSCHSGFEKETFSGLPDADTCSACHAQPQGKGDEERKLVGLLAAGKPLEWRPLFRQPAHVFYSHRRHAAAAKIDCRDCHGSIAETERPPERVRPLLMKDCLACHQRAGVSSECTGCHR